ncbi:MAG: formate/nitrite transporter family protein [Bacillota bacterium]|nr:formate/nitrite transporter family protein [Bacillota bacterium]
MDVNRISEISEAIRPEKDIDCIGLINMAKVFAGDRNAMEPCTAEAVVEILKHYYGDLSGKTGILAKADPVFVELSRLSAEVIDSLTWSGFFICNLIPVTLGNIIGGGVFVGIAYWYIYKVS